jgi:hypothetical protein
VSDERPLSESPRASPGTDEVLQSNRINVPDDAGTYRDALTTVLLRIPEGWNQTISCGPGWYPLIAQLHVKLCEMDVDYDVLQVKEKFGRLRFHARSNNGLVQYQFEAAIDDAEARSAEICEWCGAPGQLSRLSEAAHLWFKTLCRECRIVSADRGRRFRL